VCNNLVDEAADVSATGSGVVDENADGEFWVIWRVEVAAEGVCAAEGAGFALEAAFCIGAAHSVAEGAATACNGERVAVDGGVAGFGHGLKRVNECFGGDLVVAREAGAIDNADTVGAHA